MKCSSSLEPRFWPKTWEFDSTHWRNDRKLEHSLDRLLLAHCDGKKGWRKHNLFRVVQVSRACSTLELNKTLNTHQSLLESREGEKRERKKERKGQKIEESEKNIRTKRPAWPVRFTVRAFYLIFQLLNSLSAGTRLPSDAFLSWDSVGQSQGGEEDTQQFEVHVEC